MTNRNAAQGTYYENLFLREIAKDPQNIKKIAEAFSEVVPKDQKIDLVEQGKVVMVDVKIRYGTKMIWSMEATTSK